MITLKNIIEKLKNSDEVDALLVVGSQGQAEQKSYSDIDLAVILKENSQKLFSLFQYIEDRPADIFFYDIELLKKLQSDEEIPANTMDAVLVSWLEKADIKFDKSGIITSLKQDIDDLKNKLQVPISEMKKFEALINAGYITNKRYFESSNPEYFEALEIKMLYDLNNILMGYFEFRNIPWRGEKQVLRYLKENDVEFYNLYMSCVRAGNVTEKFMIYLELVNKVFSNGFDLWNKDIINPFIKGSLDEDEKSKIITYWKGLVEA